LISIFIENQILFLSKFYFTFVINYIDIVFTKLKIQFLIQITML